MNIFYPFKNSSGKKNFPSFFKLFVTLLLCLAGVSVAQAEDWYLVGDFNGWNIADSNYKFVQGWHDDPNIYYLDVDFSNEGTIVYKVYESGSGKYYGDGVSRTKCFQPTNYTQETSNCVFTYNKGTYRFFINRNNGQCLVGCTGIIVNITEQTKNADGSVYIKATYTNANDGYQMPHGYEITYESLDGTQNKSSLSPVVGLGEEGGADTENNTFWYKLSKGSADKANGNIYARVIDGQYGNSESTYYEYNPTPTTPTDLNLYVRGKSYNEWGYPGEDFKGITEDGIIYTWDWTESPKKMFGPFKIAYCNIENPGNWNNDLNFGLENAATLTFGADGTWTGTLVKNESGDMTIDPARNVKKITFKYDTKELLIETETSSSCQDLADGFTISGQFNAEILDADGLYKGSPVVSGEADPADGYWSDGARYIQLTANSVTANYFEWECTGYAIDGVAQGSVSEISWTDKDKTSARAELSLPGTYTFVCKAKCNETDEWTNSAELTITAPVPAMGFDGPIGTPASVSENGWNHAWAGQSGNGLLVRENASLKWSLTFVYQGVGSTPNDFVVIQRYKRGCVTAPDGGELGWAGFTECGAIVPGEPDFWGNKINASVIDLASGLGYTSTTEGDNFRADDLATEHGWVAGVTELTLTVTMTGWDSYTVELTKKQEQIYANYSSNDEAMGTVAMKVGNTPIANGEDITAYIGQQVTLTATPAQGYKVASWEINGKVTESDKTTISPTLSGEGLNVVVTFERDCYSGVVYDLNGGGIICANGGSTELSLSTLNNVTYQLYKDGAVYGEAVPGNGEAAKWTISEAGTYTAKAYDSRFVEECQEQAIDMKGSAVVKTVTAPTITVNPGDNVHLTVLQARSFTADVHVDWSITDVTGSGGYCEGVGYMISSQTDTSLVAKFLCIGTAKITATMKAPNQNCMAEVTVHQNGAETEDCAPEPEDMQ